VALEKAPEPLKKVSDRRCLAAGQPPERYIEVVDLKAFIEHLATLPISAVASERCRAALTSWSAMVLKSASASAASAQNGLTIYASPPDADDKHRFDVLYLEHIRGWTLGLGIWPELLAKFYVNALGGEASGHPLVQGIRQKMQTSRQRGS
jgi:hypothetical protein